jgi:hypothetical protein
VLSDPTQSEEFLRSKHWQSPRLNFQLRVQNTSSRGPAYRSNSLSGNERNRLLLSKAGGYEDFSLVSDVDCREDARSFAIFDYDQDGWLDIVLASANAPRLRIFRNQMGTNERDKSRMTRIKLTGRESNRDACGAVIMVTTNRNRRVFRKSIGEGLSSQNAPWIPVTLAPDESIKLLQVQWPSGRTSDYPPPKGPGLIELTE